MFPAVIRFISLFFKDDPKSHNFKFIYFGLITVLLLTGSFLYLQEEEMNFLEDSERYFVSENELANLLDTDQ